MKVKAKYWLNYNGVWHRAGETFEVDNYDEVKNHAELAEEVKEHYVSEIFPPDTTEQPKRRGRPKKSED